MLIRVSSFKDRARCRSSLFMKHVTHGHPNARIGTATSEGGEKGRVKGMNCRTYQDGNLLVDQPLKLLDRIRILHKLPGINQGHSVVRIRRLVMRHIEHYLHPSSGLFRLKLHPPIAGKSNTFCNQPTVPAPNSTESHFIDK